VASICLKNIFCQYGLEDKMPSTLKTSVSMIKRHYKDVCEQQGIHVVSAKAYDVVDCFAHEYKLTKDSRVLAHKFSNNIRGWYERVLESGLVCEGVGLPPDYPGRLHPYDERQNLHADD
jgi:hypothetical protein